MLLCDVIYSQRSDLASAESSVPAVVNPVADQCETVGDNTVSAATEPLPSSDRYVLLLLYTSLC